MSCSITPRSTIPQFYLFIRIPSFFLVTDRIRLRIQDNGVGFDTSQENVGNGLKSMKRRAAEMKAEFVIDSQIGEGTRIELILNS